MRSWWEGDEGSNSGGGRWVSASALSWGPGGPEAPLLVLRPGSPGSRPRVVPSTPMPWGRTPS